jgi:ABC-2 type transport system ATP-binding protein
MELSAPSGKRGYLMEYILETNGLTKVYGQKEAARDVNLHIREGQIYGLIGRNGAGKTTIMRMISGLSTPTRGSYSLFGKTGFEMEKMLKYVGVLIEHPGLYPRLSAYENLKIKCLAMGIQPKGYVEQLLELIGLENTERNKPTGAFSLGMRQRLGIGLALVGNPKIIILDEPINGLDPQGIVEVRKTLVKLRDEQGITIMISSHILDELSRLATYYGFIDSGRMIREMSAKEMEEACRKRVRVEVSNVKALALVLDQMGYEYQIQSNTTADIYGEIKVSDLAARLSGEGCELLSMLERDESLESFYMNLVGGGGCA